MKSANMILAWLSLSAILIAVFFLRSNLELWWFWEGVVFVGVATVPQWPLEKVADFVESVTPNLARKYTSKPGFENLGAFVGLVERPLFLGALVAGYPEFIPAWLVFKGIAGFRMGLEKKALTERRLFQLFLLNSAMSLAGVALGWLVWNLLGLPTCSK
jgi:hypothetical protein